MGLCTGILCIDLISVVDMGAEGRGWRPGQEFVRGRTAMGGLGWEDLTKLILGIVRHGNWP